MSYIEVILIAAAALMAGFAAGVLIVGHAVRGSGRPGGDE